MSTENILSYLKVLGRTITYLMRTHKNIKSSRVTSLYYSQKKYIFLLQFTILDSMDLFCNAVFLHKECIKRGPLQRTKRKAHVLRALCDSYELVQKRDSLKSIKVGFGGFQPKKFINFRTCL